MSSSDEISSLEYTSEEEEEQEDLLVLTIDLGSGAQDDIHIKNCEDINYMSHVFCDKHKLGERARFAIEAQIKDCLSESLEDTNQEPTSEEIFSEIASEDQFVINQSYDSAKKSTAASSLKFPSKERAQSKTEALISRMKKRSFFKLFQILSYGEETISPNSLRQCQVPIDILEIINPVLFEVMEIGTHFGFEDFCERMELLLKGLTPTEKDIIFSNKKRTKKEPERNKFKPSLKKSQKSFERNTRRKLSRSTPKRSQHVYYG